MPLRIKLVVFLLHRSSYNVIANSKEAKNHWHIDIHSDNELPASRWPSSRRSPCDNFSVLHIHDQSRHVNLRENYKKKNVIECIRFVPETLILINVYISVPISTRAFVFFSSFAEQSWTCFSMVYVFFLSTCNGIQCTICYWTIHNEVI